ncbi:hypothetical protein [Kitasatospora viridis]|uniref:Uncharacterized protein n=1 Tax=Kitasatospora viridis TaxID=281105 RepID=A0A561SAD7_9ACTN|nr:hypothetical protein [Kitasatospora viridis]TWF71765.1 hypothetical protein FHX73_18136 [Kitasatospora viridis]
MKYPRSNCRICGREVSIPGNRYARHDPPGPRAQVDLTSCPGSLKAAIPPQAAIPGLELHQAEEHLALF